MNVDNLERLADLLRFANEAKVIGHELDVDDLNDLADFLDINDVVVQRWISVEERLPEGEGWVLIIGLLLKKKKGNYGWCVPHVAEYRHGRWCDADGMLPDLEERSLKVTHWMPLPEPPKEST